MSRLRDWWYRQVPPPNGNYRGINIVNDGPAENVPEPGGLPGAEPVDGAPILIVAGERSGGLWVMPGVPPISPLPAGASMGPATPPAGTYR